MVLSIFLKNIDTEHGIITIQYPTKKKKKPKNTGFKGYMVVEAAGV
jgi:hypothetical protein